MKLIGVSIVIPCYTKNEVLHLWMQKRSEKGQLNGLWEFPGGKIEHQEDPLETAERECTEEIGITPDKLIPFLITPFEYSDRKVILHSYLWPTQNVPGRWFSLTQNDFPQKLQDIIPAANYNIIGKLLKSIPKELSC